VAGARVDDDALGVEREPEFARHFGGEAVERAAALAEDDALQDAEVRDRAGRAVDVELEAVHTRLVAQRAAPGAAVRQRPPLVAPGVVVDVREVAEAAVVHRRAAGGVELGAAEREAVDEGRLGQGGRGQRGDSQREGGQGRTKHHSVSPRIVVNAAR
jgi:hypothetical protein